MSEQLLLSTILITLAFAFYSLGVWLERFAKYLKLKHVVFFWIGFGFDISGTYAMTKLVKGGFNFLDIHTLTGQIALWLMLAHALWASYVVWRGNENTRIGFHRYSLMVWIIWLIPYFGGMMMGMSGR